MSAIDHLVSLAHRYGEAEGLGSSTVSWRVFGDTKKLPAILNGADIQVRRLENSIRWFSENWPETANWPDEVPRPAPAKPAPAETVALA